MSTITKRRFPRSEAVAVARELVAVLEPVCSRLVVAGSLRRGAPLVGDVEIVYVGRKETRQVDLFNIESVDLAASCVEGLLSRGVLSKRLSKRGTPSWGQQNKLAVHVESGIPVDLFATTEECWFNYLVCRTGPANLNMRICTLAQRKGWQWNPYGPGFSRPGGSEVAAVGSEREVFEFVGLDYLRPRERHTLAR